MSNTFDAILQRLFSKVPNTVDKREGSVVYNALAPAAAELCQVYIELNRLLDETFASTAKDYDHLKKRALERGMKPLAATKATMKGVFNIDVAIGSRFTLNKFTYEVKERIELGIFKLECETTGSEPNTLIGSIIPIGFISGLTSAVITENIIPGENEEEQEVFRNRFLNSFKSQAFGGNRADYMEKVNALAGVGGVKITRAPGGGGTVGLTIIDSTFNTANQDLITLVKSAIDPAADEGDGVGLAPIGHSVAVSSAGETVVNITTTMTFENGFNFAAVEVPANNALDAYLLELKETWEARKKDGLIVRISQFESRMLSIPGIIDVSGTQINGSTDNLTVDALNIPKRGVISA